MVVVIRLRHAAPLRSRRRDVVRRNRHRRLRAGLEVPQRQMVRGLVRGVRQQRASDLPNRTSVNSDTDASSSFSPTLHGDLGPREQLLHCELSLFLLKWNFLREDLLHRHGPLNQCVESGRDQRVYL